MLRAKHGLIGAQVSRLDGPLKVRGEARFAAEYVMEGMVYAALRYSTIARGRITTLDTSAAEAAAGVVLVMTHRNAPRMQPPPLFLTAPKAAGGSDLPVMQDDSIHWNGEPVAVVLAETQEQADHAASLIEVAYESSTPRTFEEARAHPRTPDSLVGQPVEVLVGDAEAALIDAPHSVDLTYRTPRHNHNAIEPHAVTLGVGRRRPHRPRRQPGREAARLDVRAGVRDRREPGASHLALRRRRVRRQDGVVAPSARSRGVQARRASRADHALARGRLPAGRRSHEHRAAGRDRRR